MKRLPDPPQKTDGAWIGLHTRRDGNRTWHWSLPGVEFNESGTRWSKRQPDDQGGNENCVWLKGDKWHDAHCDDDDEQKCICYNETTQTYHVSDEKMTWFQAQRYCREHHTDLISGLTQLQEFRPNRQSMETLWIGLFRDAWMWSDGSSSSFRQFKTDKVILIKENKTWDEALNYCREKHQDLISIINPDQQRWVQERAMDADTPFVWVGMRYTCTLRLWFWVSGHLVCYDNWAPDKKTENRDMAAAMDRGGGMWFAKADNSTFNFICTL
ncbi:uncharacterized protein LOC115024012 [Cottoperca gobio]|uniref:Uncharacterized protein LOC115024012 n=1 Tax=Cottoperca gobio TaxID=56716 RepID=A0A6J2RM03_COTGO|nr:uncharacterized protein LOC115024012 [Cottoperca gobio]